MAIVCCYLRAFFCCVFAHVRVSACVNAMLSNIFVVRRMCTCRALCAREIDFVFALNWLCVGFFFFFTLFCAMKGNLYHRTCFHLDEIKRCARAEHTKRIGHGFQCMHCATAHTEDSESERVIIMRVFTYSSFFRTGFFSLFARCSRRMCTRVLSDALLYTRGTLFSMHSHRKHLGAVGVC